MAARRPISHATTRHKSAFRLVLKPLGRDGAHAMQQSRTIWVDPRGRHPHLYLLHELIHLSNPAWSETQVRRETAREWRRMTWREKAALLRMFGRARIGEDEE